MASTGIGTPGHVGGELFKMMAKADDALTAPAAIL
jgi:hypothetical protein